MSDLSNWNEQMLDLAEDEADAYEAEPEPVSLTDRICPVLRLNREAHLDAIMQDFTVYEDLLAYFDEHEPAVADAIRYGVSVNQLGQMMVNYPQAGDSE